MNVTSIGFIGGGNMGEAFIGALIRTGITSADRILVSDVSNERRAYLRNSYGVNALDDNGRVFDASDVVMLAVKPQQMQTVLESIAQRPGYAITERKLVVSIAAGVRIGQIESVLYAPLDTPSRQRLPIVRVMPNTPALVLTGMSGMSANRHTDGKDLQRLRTILEAVGRVIEFAEDALDAVTAVSGSGPAYVFYLAEAMNAAAEKVGLPTADARTLVLTTLKGAVALMEQRQDSPAQLRAKVTSPGGTTEAALKVFEAGRVKQTIIEGIEAATARARELSR